jgi:hypothetical protein
LTIGTVRVQEDVASSLWSGFGLCDFLFRIHERTIKRRSIADEEEHLTVLSELVTEIPPAMVLRVLANGIDCHGVVALWKENRLNKV